jgi:hypothetical protein
VGYPLPCDALDRSLFATATTITIGDGAKANFWKDRWMHDEDPCEITPAIFKIAIHKNRTVK